MKNFRRGEVCAYDMAILRLYTPLGNNLGWFGGKVYDDDWEDEPYWGLIGYPIDICITYEGGI